MKNRRDARRARADERRDAREARTDDEQRAILDTRPGNSLRERLRLTPPRSA